MQVLLNAGIKRTFSNGRPVYIHKEKPNRGPQKKASSIPSHSISLHAIESQQCFQKTKQNTMLCRYLADIQTHISALTASDQAKHPSPDPQTPHPLD